MADDLSGDPLRSHQPEHDGRDQSGLVPQGAREHLQVDQEAGDDEEGGNEKSIGEEFGLFLGRRAAHRLVDGEAGQECADDALELQVLGEGGADADDAQHQREGGFVGLAQLREQPTPGAAQHEDHDEDEQPEFGELDGEGAQTEARLVRGDADRQHQQRQHVGQDGGTHRHGHGQVPGETGLQHDRVGDQGVGGEQRTDQECRQGRVAEEQPDGEARQQGQGEGHQAEYQRFGAMLAELLQVDFEADEEHQQKLAEFGEEIGDLGICRHDAERVRSDDDADQNVSHHGRDTQALRHVGGSEQQEHDHCETRHRRQVDRSGVHVHRLQRD